MEEFPQSGDTFRSLSLGLSQGQQLETSGIKLGSLWHERVKSLTQGRCRRLQRSTVNIFSPSGDSNLAGVATALTSCFQPCSAMDETVSF